MKHLQISVIIYPMSAIVISPDDIKSGISGYIPEKSEVVHLESVRIADKIFSSSIKDNSSPHTVILMCGGSASGKSEYIEKVLLNKNVIIYDGTLSTEEGAKVKIRNCKDKHKKIKVVSVLPHSFTPSFLAFINRERRYPVSDFFKTHIGSRNTLKFIIENYIDIEIVFIESYIDGRKEIKFMRIRPTNPIDYINSKQITEEIIQKEILESIS